MWIDMRIKNSNVLRSDCDRCGNRESWPPPALVPRQIDPRYILQRQTAQQRNTRVASVVQIDRFFKVEPPLALHWLNAARDFGSLVGPVHSEFCRELLGNMMTARALGPHVSLLQREHIDRWQHFSISKRARCQGDLTRHVFR